MKKILRQDRAHIYMCEYLCFVLLLSIWRFDVTSEGLFCFVFMLLMGGVCWYDLRERRIPNKLNLAIFGVGIVRVLVAILGNGVENSAAGASGTATIINHVGDHLVGGIIIALPMLLMTMVIEGAFGGGDIKLCASAGLCLGIQGSVFGACVGMLLAGIFGLGMLLWEKVLKKAKSTKRTLPLGPFLAIGYVVCIFGWI